MSSACIALFGKQESPESIQESRNQAKIPEPYWWKFRVVDASDKPLLVVCGLLIISTPLWGSGMVHRLFWSWHFICVNRFKGVAECTSHWFLPSNPESQTMKFSNIICFLLKIWYGSVLVLHRCTNYYYETLLNIEILYRDAWIKSDL